MIDFEALGAPERVEAVGGIVSGFRSSSRMAAAVEQRRFYATDNPGIMERRRMYAGMVTRTDDTGLDVIQAVSKENKFAANEKIASSFFADITDQKVQYIAGEGADVNAVDESKEADAAVAAVFDPISRMLRRVEQMCLTDALVYGKGYAYLQVIGGRLKLTHVDACEVVPIRDDYGNLRAVVRYFCANGREYAEYHTPDKVFEFMRNDGEDWKACGERWQIAEVVRYPDGSTVEAGGRGWPVLPWFEMQHNNAGTSSLTPAVRSMIRCYDIVVSDFANNLIDVQDVFVTIKNSGYAAGMGYDEQLEMLKVFKMTEGDLDTKTVEVPFQARKELEGLLKANIYSALRGVDVSLIAGGQLTNTAIRALYSDIDLWADTAEWWLEDWVVAVLEAVAWYAGVELPLVNVTFTRSAIFDEVEKMNALAAQKGVISDKTLFEAHPLVDDAQAELERIEAEQAGAAYGLEVNASAAAGGF